MSRQRFVLLFAWIAALALTLAGSSGDLHPPLLLPANVRVGDDAGQRVRALWTLTEQALPGLDGQKAAETAEAYQRRQDATRRLMLRIAWFESIQLRHRRQIRGPARSFYQIEPIRAQSCCQMAERRGWMDDLADACGHTPTRMRDACADLTPTRWPRGNLVEQCLVENDLFATTMARICLEPLPDPVPMDVDAHAELWAAVWKRAFTSAEQRLRQKQGFVDAAKTLEPLLPLTSPPDAGP